MKRIAPAGVRPPAGTPGDVLWGYNDTPIRPAIGPGYYVVHDTPGTPLGASAFDYTQLPTSRPPSDCSAPSASQ